MTTERDKHAELFADYMIEAMARTRMRQSDIARSTGLSRTTISNLVGKKPSTLTGKLLLPGRETVDKIARAFGDPVGTARRAAGYLTEREEPQVAESSQEDRETEAARAAEMLELFLRLPPDVQVKALAMVKILQPTDKAATQEETEPELDPKPLLPSSKTTPLVLPTGFEIQDRHRSISLKRKEAPKKT